MKKKVRAVFFIEVSILILLVVVFVAMKTQQKNAQEDIAAEEPVIETPVEPVAEEEPEEKPRTIDDVENKNDPDSYTYEEIDEEIYFGASNASVRKLPWDEGELVGTLYKDQTVNVYGKCIETGYYKIKLNGKFLYVSEDELSQEYYPIDLPLPDEIKQPTKEKEILFVGNSITLHGPADFWWGDMYGMGATSKANDYAHLTASAMGYSKYDITSMRDWELKDARNNYLKYLDSYITKYDYKIVSIFLGENAKGHEGHFGGDLADMCRYIQAYNPDVKIVIVDNFWKYDDIIEMKKAAAEEVGATYCSLADLWDDSTLQLKAGQTIEANGGTYTVDSFVAGHPNNKGMKAISEKLVETLKKL